MDVFYRFKLCASIHSMDVAAQFNSNTAVHVIDVTTRFVMDSEIYMADAGDRLKERTAAGEEVRIEKGCSGPSCAAMMKNMCYLRGYLGNQIVQVIPL